MLDFFSTYWMYIKTYFKARAQYRTSFLLGIVANFYCYFITYISYWVITNSNGTIAGWDFSDLSILYGLSLITYAVTGVLIWYTVYHLEDLIVSGRLDIMLLRPQGILQQMIFQQFGDTFLGQIVVTILFLSGAFVLRSEPMAWYMWIYLAAAIIGGIFLQSGSMILFGAFSFWTVKSRALIDVVFYDLRDMTKYPLIIYPKILRIILTFVLPWGFINYYPALMITGKTNSLAETLLGLAAPVVGLLWFCFAVVIFRLGLRRYTSAGS